MNWTSGQPLRALTKPAITKDQLRLYASASGDTNPIHLDEAFAREAGFPSVIVHGMLSMAFLADHLQYNFPPSEYHVVKLRSRFRKVTFPGDVLSCEGRVKKAESGSLHVALLTRNQRGEITTEGEAEIKKIS
ncbi:MaoC family dehydratase N-terminal domain-containing protein [bacterium]|nr:MaoC family dehydratase N-terminal domain-containing protein [bacterium]